MDNDMVLNVLLWDFMDFGKCDVTSVAVVTVFIKQTVVYVFVAEFLALCPTGIGTTGDGRGNVIHKLKPLTTLKPSGAAYI